PQAATCSLCIVLRADMTATETATETARARRAGTSVSSKRPDSIFGHDRPNAAGGRALSLGSSGTRRRKEKEHGSDKSERSRGGSADHQLLRRGGGVRP